MRILLVNDSLPYPVISGTPLRICNLYRRIAREHEVSLVAFIEDEEQAEGIPYLSEIFQHIEMVKLQRRSPVAHLPNLVRYALAGKPLELSFHYSAELASRIRHLVTTEHFDIVHIEHSHMAPYLEVLPPQLHARALLTLIDVVYAKYDRLAHVERRLGKRMRAWLYSRMMRRWEPSYLEQFGRCIAMSETDRRLLMGVNPRLRISVVPNGVDTRACPQLPPPENRKSLISVGSMSHDPNVDSALYFCQEVLPLIKASERDVETWIVGANPPPEVVALNGDSTHVTGRVPEVIPYYQHSAVCVVPLRAGGGTRLKILESMALGRPVVSTSVGCEGLDVVDGESILIADTPQEFADKTLRLLRDEALYDHLVTKARRLVEERYDWDILARQLLDVYAEINATG